MKKRFALLGIALAGVLADVSPSSAASFTPLGDLPGGIFKSAASGVSADGSVVVGNSNSAAGTEAFRWTLGGGMVGLGDLPGGNFSSEATAVSADGTVVVGFSEVAGLGTEAFRWTSGGGMAGLGFLPGGGTSALPETSPPTAR
jgi:probable HAF family extracellular repeat protein